jgi:hypothetical protein
MFTVSFSTREGRRYAIEDAPRECGLRALDKARAQLGPGILSVRHDTSTCYYVVPISLTEAQARRAFSAFENVNDAIVHVPPAALNRYVRYKYRIVERRASEAIQTLTVAEDQLVEDWLAAGAPAEWVPPALNAEANS